MRYYKKIKNPIPILWKWLAITAILLLPLLFAGSAPAQAQGPQYDHPGIVHGVHSPPIWQNNTEIDAYNNLMGKDAGIVMSYYPWDLQFEDWTCGFFDNTFRHREDGGEPGVNECMKDFDPDTPEIDTVYMITWEPLRNPTGTVACNVAPGGRTDLNAIINGSCDAYINDFANRLKAWNARFGDRFMIRLMHEMNNVNSPWFQNDANYPARFKAAWQHVYDRFRAQGVSREAAQFVWAPNWQSFPASDWNKIPNYYPGDTYVEWIGLSGYNWYGQNGQDPAWRTFDGLFVDPIPELGQGVLPYLHCHYAKPIMIAEFGTVEGPGGAQTKTAWIQNAYQRMQDFPYLRAAIYFNDYAFGSPGNADFRVSRGSSDDPRTEWPPEPGYHQSLGPVTDVYKAQIADADFIEDVPSLTDVTPTSTYCGGQFPPPSPTINVPDSVLAEAGQTLRLTITGENLQGTYNLEVSNVSGDIEASVQPGQISPTSPSATLTIQVGDSAPGNANLTITADGPGLEPINQSIQVHIVEELQRIYLPVTMR